MISVEGLKVEFGVKPLFHDVNFVINDRDRIALVGKNGAGKSTMLKILCGMQKPTDGVVAVPNETTIGYLPQVMKLQDDTTVKEETRKAFAHNTEMKARLDKMQQEMADRTDYESESYAQLVEKFTQEHERYMMMGGENYEAEIERTLTGLGFTREDFDRPTREFSGGWRMRIELAKILLQKPDVLLLDEPTNHLDIESIQWLEQFLAQSAKAVVLVSHDRAFINNVTNRTLEITCGRVEDYRVKYDEYVVLRAERREQQLRAYENQQKEIADIKDFIERFRYKPTKAVQVQSRIKQLEKIVPETFDKIFRVFYFFLLILVSTQLLFAAFLTQHDKLIVSYLVIVYPSAGNFNGTVGHVVNECPVVTYQHYRTGTHLQEILQPLDTLNVQVVGRLVEQQHIGTTQQKFR